ncbi:MAG: segregation/condensation protein A [Acetobacteraceae bacterium]|nr:segregation/condensation protein A [Acetobacteraceae bacterium]
MRSRRTAPAVRAHSLSPSRAGRDRLICCSSSRAIRRSISPGISVLRLAEQYLDWIARARALDLEIAADYLVMAAWLAYLKSRLLLPPAERPADEPSPEAAAEALAWQLRRLEAMREAGAALMARAAHRGRCLAAGRSGGADRAGTRRVGRLAVRPHRRLRCGAPARAGEARLRSAAP